MAGRQFTVNLPAKTIAKAAKQIAEENGYRIDETDLFSFRLKKGNFVLSLFVGAFVAYCDFAVEIEEEDDGVSTFTLRRNTPWWTGAIGVHRVNKAAIALADLIAEELSDLEGSVSNKKDV